MSARELLQKDIKTFTIHGHSVCVAQLELYALQQVDAVLDDLRQEMARYAEEKNAALVVLMLTDINLGDTSLWFAGAELSDIPQPCKVEGMLSRKKQMLPLAGKSFETTSVGTVHRLYGWEVYAGSHFVNSSHRSQRCFLHSG